MKLLLRVSKREDIPDAIQRAKELGANVDVVDGNLTKGDKSGNDGRMIATGLREEIPGITIVSFSGEKQSYGDVHVSKGDIAGIMKLGQLITNL